MAFSSFRAVIAASATAAGWLKWNGTIDGTATLFDNTSPYAVSNVSSCFVDTNKVLVTYVRNGVTYAIVLTFSDTTITIGTPVTILAASGQPKLVKIDTTKVFVAYNDSASSDSKAVILSISGSTITLNTVAALSTGSTTLGDCVLLSSTKILLNYGGQNAKVITISGTTISAVGAVQDITEGSSITTTGTNLVVLSSTTVLFIYRRAGPITGVRHLTISGDTVTETTETQVTASLANFLCSVLIDTNKVLVTYRDGGNSNFGTARIITVSGTTPTVGSAWVFDNTGVYAQNGDSENQGTIAISTKQAMVIYGNNTNAYGIVLSISGSSVTSTPSKRVQIDTGGNMTAGSAVLLDSKRIVAIYNDNGNSDKGTAKVLKIT